MSRTLKSAAIQAAIMAVLIASCNVPKIQNPSTEVGKTLTTQLIPVDQSKEPPCYIDFIEKFEGTNELYTHLYFQESFDYSQYEKVLKLGDSLIYKDDEIKRTRIPMREATKYFDLSGLETIEIFDSNHNKINEGKLKRIELLEDLIESQFVAVFTLNDMNDGDQLYCVGNRNWIFTEDLSFSPMLNEVLTQAIINRFDLDKETIWNIQHYESRSMATTYSVVSADTTAFIIEVTDSSHKVLYKSKTSESINDLVIIPTTINGHPLLLAKCGMPETDMSWTSLLTYKGEQYEVTKHNRLSD